VSRCTRFGSLKADDERTARELVLVEADSPEQLEVWPDLPSVHFICLVVWDAPQQSDVLLNFARKLLDAGAVYVCAFGEGCERVHDAVDEVVVTGNREPDANHVIMTTWHAHESLDDALWFALYTAFPAAAYESTCRAIVVLTIGAQRHVEALRRDLAAPQAFSERVLAELPNDDAEPTK
jgi:hypothetical protein